MEQLTPRVTAKKKKWPIILATLSILLITNSLVLLYFLPSFKQATINSTNEINIYYMGKLIEGRAIKNNDQLYIPFTFIKNYVDEDVLYDKNENLIIITTDKDLFQFPLGKKDGFINTKPYSFSYPTIQDNGEVYLAINPLKDIYDLDINFVADNNLLLIHQLNSPIQQGVIVSDTKIRENPSIRSPWIENVNENDEVYIYSEDNGWYWVSTKENQILGYVKKDNVKLSSILVNDTKREVYQPWNPIGTPIVLSWEYATRTTVDPKEIGTLSGLQVLSPTWFHLQQDNLVKNSADKKYVDWAHKKGYQVWGLFSNSFEPDLTHVMLNSPNNRMKVIKQLLSYVDLYQLDGINLDFENVNIEDKEELVQFVRELTPLLHEKDRTVSMDVTFISKSENWSMFYDREKLGGIVDYIIIMAYDEHWASSPKAGSVASLPWVENGLKQILEQVPNDKLILGVPFYTRLWTEQLNENGDIEVSSRALSMESAQEWIKEKNAQVVVDEKSGQHYVEVKEGNITYKMWLEDLYSMGKRIELMKKYRLAGIGAWRRGFEEESFWDGISKVINKR